MRKLILLILTSLCFCTLLPGCSSSKPSDPITVDTATPASAVENIEIVKDGETDYVIVRPEVDQYGETDSAIFMHKYLKNCGIISKIITDWEGNGTQDHEIVIGHSDRLKDTDLDLEAVGEKG